MRIVDRIAIFLCLLASVPGLARDPLFCRLPFIQLASQYELGVPKTQNEYLLRRTKVDGAPYHEVLVVTEYEASPNFKTTVIRREVRSGVPEAQDKDGKTVLLPGLKEDPAAAYDHMSLIRPIVAKNLGIYKSRRPHWTGDFRQHLATAAQEYLNDSVYVAVTNKQTGDIVAGVRFILSPYGIKEGKVVAEGPTVRKYYGPVTGFREPGETLGPNGLPRPPRAIPEENELKIVLDTPAVETSSGDIKGGLNIEMGTLFVDETLSKADHGLVWGELWLQTLKMANDSRDPELNYYGTTIHAYADKPSKRLYLPIGFELLRSYTHQGKQVSFGPDEEVTPVTKPDGSKWWPIVYQTEKIDQFVRDWSEGKYPNRDGTQVRRRLAELANADGEPVAVSVEQVQALLSSFRSDTPRVSHAAGLAIKRLIELQASHVKKMRQANPDSNTARRAKFASESLDGAMNELELQMPALLKDSDPDRRAFVAVLARVLIQTTEYRPQMKPSHVLGTYLIPLLSDRDLRVRLSAAQELRSTFSDRAKLREKLGVGDDNLKEREKALAVLFQYGVPRRQINPAVRDLALLLESPVPPASALDPIVNQQSQIPIDTTAVAMMPFVGRDPVITRQLLILASLRESSPADPD